MKIKLGLGSMTLKQATAYCGGECVGDGQASFEYVCTDSREADENTLFVATRGERVDGHNYISSAEKLGGSCFLCEYIPNGVSHNSGFCIVKNSIDAFSSLAKGYKADCPIDTVAITGSVGKTTTKELTSLVLSQGFELYRTEGNFNSIIGMPMSMLEVGREHSIAVFEMGMSGFGEIRSMSLTATPKIALITNIGSSHLEHLGTRENIARAKFEIADGLRDGGTLLLNGDEPLLRELADNKTDCNYNVMYASMKGNGDFCAENIRHTENGSTFDVKYKDDCMRDIFLPAVGDHLVFDALFACAAGILMGLDRKQISTGLAGYIPGAYRQRIYDCNGVKIIADCYNAAPESVKGALKVLSGIGCDRKIAVLGDMRELGENTAALHREVGAEAAKSADVLYCVGELGKYIAEGAAAAGMSNEKIFVDLSDNAADTCSGLCDMLCTGDAVLFKASRAMRLENIIEYIEKNRR